MVSHLQRQVLQRDLFLQIIGFLWRRRSSSSVMNSLAGTAGLREGNSTNVIRYVTPFGTPNVRKIHIRQNRSIALKSL